MRIVKVRGDSMLPRYRDGDFVVTARYGRRRPQPGDDVVFMHPDFGMLLKRIERVDDGRLTLRGLNILSADPAALGSVDIGAATELRRVTLRFPGRQAVRKG